MSPTAVLRLRRGAVALAAAVVPVLTPAVPASAALPPAQLGSDRIAAQVRALDREVTRVSVALTAGVTRYEQAQDRLARLTQDRLERP